MPINANISYQATDTKKHSPHIINEAENVFVHKEKNEKTGKIELKLYQLPDNFKTLNDKEQRKFIKKLKGQLADPAQRKFATQIKSKDGKAISLPVMSKEEIKKEAKAFADAWQPAKGTKMSAKDLKAKRQEIQDAWRPYQINGTSKSDVIVVDPEIDIGMEINGNAGDDIIHGGSGDDIINEGAGSGKVKGGKGDDRITGGKGDDDLSGGKGVDNIHDTEGKNTLRPGPDNKNEATLNKESKIQTAKGKFSKINRTD